MTTNETLVCGNQVQMDKSGVGHCWVDVDACDLPASIVEELEGEMIDGGMEDGGEMTGSNGIKYRW